MAIRFQPSRQNGLGSPEVIESLPLSTATYLRGAPVTRDGTDPEQMDIHPGGNTVTGIVGVALQDVTTGTPDFGSMVQIAKAGPQIEFLGQVISGSTVQTIAGDGTYEGSQYGMVASSNEWFVDAADTTDVVLTVTKELPDINCVLFKFLASAISD